MPLLSNAMWHSLSGAHAHLSAGTDRIRRYAKGISPMIGYGDPSRPEFDAIAPFCEAGERFYCAEWTGAEPDGWKIEVDSSMCAMVWDAPAPPVDDALGAVRLTQAHVPQMVALTELTRPGPFGTRTIELGEWHGVFDGDRLVAMAGERMQVDNLHEVSGICTLPEYRGRGLAKRLTALMVRIQLARGERPCLHVASANTPARELYRKMGFALDQEVAMRIVSRR